MTLARSEPTPSFAEATGSFARIGLLSFGGPAGQIALMHRVLVEEKKWLDEARFLHALNYCMILPGPEAMQLATYSGWLLHGVRGGLMAGLLFVLPGALVITLLSALYLALGQEPLAQGLLFGLKAAVLAVVLDALIKVSRRALKTPLAYVLAVAAFLALMVLNVPFPAVIVIAALVGIIADLVGPNTGAAQAASLQSSLAPVAMPEWTRPSLRRFLSTLAAWLMIWFAPLILLAAALGSQHVLVTEGVFFSKMAAVTFGGAYAVLAYVAQQAVEIYGWLKPDEMLTGLGLAETTPGPLILVLVFVGFLGGARLSGFDPIVGGLAGAAVTLWFTFVPCFLWIFAGAPYVETLRGVRWLSSALSAVTAAVVGVIANLGVWFALHVLFADVGSWTAGLISMPVPAFASFQPVALVIATLAAIALIWFKANMILVLATAALAGMAWSVL